MTLRAYLICLTVLSSATACRDDVKTSFHYDDLQAFEGVLEQLEAGADTLAAFESYLADASPGLTGWSGRYQVSAERFTELYPRFSQVFEGLPALEAPLRAREAHIEESIERMRSMSGLDPTIPVYFFVSSQHLMGGTPVLADTVVSSAVAVGVEPDTDLDEPIDWDRIAESLAQVAIHEVAHIFQMYTQGGIETYRSIYDPEQGSMAAVAIREGCAEYITYLVSGDRFGDRHLYVDQHERELWDAFREVAFEPPFSVPGWFGGVSESNPEWPFQVGYSLGFNMCEAYHLAAEDPDARLPDLFRLYDADDIEAIWTAFDARF